MLEPLVTSLASLGQFLSRGFLISAFVPTLVFLFSNALILYVWSWPFNNWARNHFLDAPVAEKSLTFAILFFAVWIASYITAALTAFWTRTLEGTTWPEWLRKAGVKSHSVEYKKASFAIDKAVSHYARIEQKKSVWDSAIRTAAQNGKNPPDEITQPTATLTFLKKLKALKEENKLIEFEQIDELTKSYVKDFAAIGYSKSMDQISVDLSVIRDYAFVRAKKQEETLRGDDFVDPVGVRPTRFGNVGVLAEQYVKRAYKCNLVLVWSALRRVAATEKKLEQEITTKAIDDCKMQLDFFVAFFWLSLAFSVGWAGLFAWSGFCRAAVAFATVGPFICWTIWYGAAVEQYRAFQTLIISQFNGPLRFEVIRALRFDLSVDICEERMLWETVDYVINQGKDNNLRYKHS